MQVEWWRQSNLTCCNQIHLNFLHFEIVGDAKNIFLMPACTLSPAGASRLVKLSHHFYLAINGIKILFQGVVSGTLLVTPNAIMFDPNVSDTLVIEHGADMYGRITIVISLSIVLHKRLAVHQKMDSSALTIS